jgi:hypothetical protein
MVAEGRTNIPPRIPVAVIPVVRIPVSYVIPWIPHPPVEVRIVEATDTVAVIVLLNHIDCVTNDRLLSREHHAITFERDFRGSVEGRRTTVVGVNVPIVVGLGGPDVVRGRLVSQLAAVLTAVVDVVLRHCRDCCR